MKHPNRSFIDKVRPPKNLDPLAELTAAFEKSKKDRIGFVPFGATLQGRDQLVELRIRQWMQREKEAQQNRAPGKNPASPKNKPPSPEI